MTKKTEKPPTRGAAVVNINSGSRLRKNVGGGHKPPTRFVFTAEQKEKITGAYADSLEYAAQGFDQHDVILDFINDVEKIINSEELAGE